MGPQFMLNTQSNSAPSPINATLGIGIQLPLGSRYLIFAPHIAVSNSYYLWYDNMALPAEIENRTAIVPTILLDLPILGRMHLGKNILSIGVGASVLARFGILTTGVPANEAGDVNKINSFFWEDLNWLYPSMVISFDRKIQDNISVGIGAKGYLPLGALMKGRGLDTGMLTLSARLMFAKN